jgi:hypothetical protein
VLRARAAVFAVVTVVALLVAACSGGGGGKAKKAVAYPLDRTLRLNEVQVLASHNSYHIEPSFPLPEELQDSLQYSHAPLDEQLESQGVRGFELDVVNGPGDGEFQVTHTPVVDANTNCTPLSACLAVVKKWSAAHPGHVPISILIEPKDGLLERGLDPRLGTFDQDGIDRLDAQVRESLGKQLIPPDQVRGKSTTLRAAVTERGWPSLRQMRGKVMVILNNGSGPREHLLRGHPSLEGRAMFVTADEKAPSAAVIKVDLPDVKRIRRLVDAGFIVRTRSDADLVEARAHDTTRRDAALRSGAQIISTDFQIPVPSVAGRFVVRIPDGTPGRCNPVNAPRPCRARDVESPRYLSRT